MVRRRTASFAVAMLIAVLGAWGGPASADPSPTAYAAIVWHSGLRFSPGAGVLHDSWALLYSTGSVTGFVTTTVTTSRLRFAARADLCDGAPVVEAAVDGVTVSHLEVDGWGAYAAVGSWPAGRHQVTLRYLNDHRSATCDRNVEIGTIELTGWEDGTVQPASVGQEARLRYAVVSPAAAATVSTYQIAYTGDATTTMRLDSQAASDLLLSAERVACGGTYAGVTISVDGGSPSAMPAGGASLLEVAGSWADGPHTVTLRVTGTSAPGCPRPVTLDLVTFEGVL